MKPTPKSSIVFQKTKSQAEKEIIDLFRHDQDTEAGQQPHDLKLNFAHFRSLYYLQNKQGSTFYRITNQSTIEDGYKTSFYFGKLLAMRNLHQVIVISLFFLGYFAYVLEFNEGYDPQYGKTFYNVLSAFTFVQFIYYFFEHAAQRKYENQKKINNIRTRYEWYHFAIKLLYLIHPTSIFFRQKSTIGEQAFVGSKDILSFRRNINEFLFLFQTFVNFFHIAKTMFMNLEINNVSSDRIYRMNDLIPSVFLIAKTQLKKEGLLPVLISLIFIIIFFGFTVKIAESPLSQIKEVPDSFKKFRYLSICFWNTMITAFTIGYGDTYPGTYLGRMFIIMLGFSAGVLLAILTVNLLKYFTYEPLEEQATKLVDTLMRKQMLEKAAKEVLKTFFRHWAERNGEVEAYKKTLKEFKNAKENFYEVKKNIEKEKNLEEGEINPETYIKFVKLLHRMDDFVPEVESYYRLNS